MTEASEQLDGVVERPDWTPWGEPRKAERGVETAFHHPLILLRARSSPPRVVAPGDVLAGDGAGVEWSPMPWAQRGRRQWRSPSALGPGSVFRGSSDRLFLASDWACEQLFEGDCLGPRSLRGWVEALKLRSDRMDARGVAYRLLVVPEGHAIHSETIAGAPRLSQARPLMQILREADDRTRARLVYPLEALIDGCATSETSHPHDVHLTGYGFYLCYRALMASLPNVDPARVLGEADLFVRKTFIAGDIARSVAAPGRRVDMHEAPWPRHRALVKGASYKTHQVDVFEAEETGLPTLVLFRTSNSSHLFPHLLRHFSRIVAVATTRVLYDLVESEKPDVVVSELPERYFAHAEVGASETDRGGPPADCENEFELRTGHSLPLPRG